MTQQEQRKSLLGKIAAYTEILAKDPGSTIFVSLAEAYRKMGMLDDARQIIVQGLEAHTDFSPAHVVLGRVFCQLGDYTQSETSFKTAIEFDAESLAALVGYARVNILLGREEEARLLLIEARDLSPADSVINKLLLSLPPEPVQEEAVETADAEAAADDQVETPLPLASSTLADLYLKQGLKQQALDIYRQLSVEDPNNLVLRRQIRELEEELQGDSSELSLKSPAEDLLPEGPAPADTDIPPAETDDEQTFDDLSVLEDPPVAAQPAENPAAVEEFQQATASPSDEQVLSALNQWLDNIRQRREHV